MKSSPRGTQRPKKSGSTRYRLVNGKRVALPELTASEVRELEEAGLRQLAAMKKAKLPPITDAMLRSTFHGNPHPAIKQQLTVRLDADILEWLKGFGRGYQTKLNAMLKAAMNASR